MVGTENGVYTGMGYTQPGITGHWVGGNPRPCEERRRPSLPSDGKQTQAIGFLCVFGDWHTVVSFAVICGCRCRFLILSGFLNKIRNYFPLLHKSNPFSVLGPV